MTRIRSRTGGLLLLLALASSAAAAAEPSVRARSDQALATYFSDEDYPSDAVRNGESGAVGFRLAVGPDGRPAGCAVTVSSGSVSLDSTTCRLLMERTRFQPARDSQGKHVADALEGRIVWRLPVETMGRPEAAMSLWGVCVLGEAAKLALSDLSTDEVTRRAYLPCAALEAQASRELGESLGARRSETVQGFEELIFKARAVLKAPRPIPSPSKP